ncbi:MAG: hypothetical protein AAF826_11030 [Pseudomonadota bacterium]
MPMIKFLFLLVALGFPEKLNGSENTLTVWERYEDRAVYIVSLEGERDAPSKLYFEFNYEASDGKSFVAIIRGHSVAGIKPIINLSGCFSTQLYEEFEFTISDYVFCLNDTTLLLANVDFHSPDIMPRSLVFNHGMKKQ